MAVRKKTNPLSDRSRALNAEIAALEARVKKLNQNLEKNKTEKPHVRSSAYPGGKRVEHSNGSGEDLILEHTDQYRLQAPFDSVEPPEEQLDIARSGLAYWLHRLKSPFRKHPPINPKLINYLAAGSFQGLPPLRYEKRVARNRVLLLFMVFLILLLGVLAIFYKH